jgi:hypothetical protein
MNPRRYNAEQIALASVIARCWRRSQLRTDLLKHGSGISLGAATAAVALATLQATGVIR